MTHDDTPKIWRNMTREEKGAILLARHEGKEIETFHYGKWIKTDPYFYSDFQAYRVKPEPKLETMTLGGEYAKGMGWIFGSIHPLDVTHRITFDLIDGKPDCDSIKMEKITQ